MPKTFRPYQPDQRLLLPPGLDELLPEGDLAYFIRDTVAQLDLGPILAEYREERGQPPFHPTMMTALLLYAYCRGTYSSRRIAQACELRSRRRRSAARRQGLLGPAGRERCSADATDPPRNV